MTTSRTRHVSRPRFRTGLAGLAATTLLGLALTGCTSSAAPESPTSGTTGSSTASAPASDAVTVDITIAKGGVSPSGQKLDVTRGRTVVLRVTSDQDEEIHAHTAGDGYELEVRAGQTATGQFVASDAGSFEVEAHHLEKVIVILNVR